MEPEVSKLFPRGNERILLVDNDEIIVKSVRILLEYLGYKATTFSNSVEALKFFSANSLQFGLVMTDQSMPYMTGRDLRVELRRIRPSIPVILCSGSSDRISSERAMAMGFQGFIMKPFTLREGAEIIRRVLDQERSK